MQERGEKRRVEMQGKKGGRTKKEGVVRTFRKTMYLWRGRKGSVGVKEGRKGAEPAAKVVKKSGTIYLFIKQRDQ